MTTPGASTAPSSFASDGISPPRLVICATCRLFGHECKPFEDCCEACEEISSFRQSSCNANGVIPEFPKPHPVALATIYLAQLQQAAKRGDALPEAGELWKLKGVEAINQELSRLKESQPLPGWSNSIDVDDPVDFPVQDLIDVVHGMNMERTQGKHNLPRLRFAYNWAQRLKDQQDIVPRSSSPLRLSLSSPRLSSSWGPPIAPTSPTMSPSGSQQGPPSSPTPMGRSTGGARRLG